MTRLIRPTFINAAEAILDPLWDGQLSGFAQGRWTVAPGAAHGLRLEQRWDCVAFEWSRRPAEGPGLCMSRPMPVEVAEFDHLVVRVVPPTGAVVRISAETDRGLRTYVSSPAAPLKTEYLLPLDGASRLAHLTIEIVAGSDGAASGWISWIGLQNSAILTAHLRSFNAYDPAWENHLQPSSYEPAFLPSYGLVIAPDEIEIMRLRHDAHLREYGSSPFLQAVEAAVAIQPESRINEFVNFWGDTRYCRDRDQGRGLLGTNPEYGASLAIAALLTRNKEMLRHAARFAMSLAICANWDDGFVTRYPGSAWEHRSFVQSRCCYVLGVALDLLGEMFTTAGRDLILRRLAESGLGAINYTTWKHEYIFNCNQLAWFTEGRLLAYAVLEQHFPRVASYTDIACRELIESLDKTILADGGYVEGPMYFACIARFGVTGMSYYARSRGKTLQEILPACLARTGDFAAATASTAATSDVIPICDSEDRLDLDTLAIMAATLPQSSWVDLYRKAVGRTQGMPSTLTALRLDSKIPAAGPALPPLVILPVMGIVASHRPQAGGIVKLFLMGNKSGAGHSHEDKGSFILECGGEILACDSGKCDYSSPLATEYRWAQRHNMLVPTGTADRPHPACPLFADICPKAKTEGDTFFAHVDLTPGWEDYYKFWRREWDSPQPDRLIITDHYELAQGDGVDFLWQTRHRAAVEPEGVVITTARTRLVLTFPSEATAHIDSLPVWDGNSTQQRIVIHFPKTQGTLRVAAQWTTRES